MVEISGGFIAVVGGRRKGQRRVGRREKGGLAGYNI
uniref:Uncharacterized protein n=1 Tax=Solanum lycopersicum TaxID=4081 RepID=A0A3Q7IN18_SOLLC